MVIAQRILVSIFAHGEQQEIHLKIGKPHMNADGDWQCEVAIDGLFSQLHPIVGSDAFQALMLAQSFMKDLLRQKLHQEMKLFDRDCAEEIVLDELFSGLC